MTFAGPGYGPSTTPPANVTTYSITPSGLTSGNYAITFVPGTFTLNKMPAAVRAVDASKTYGDADPALTTIRSGIWDTLDVPPITFSATRAPGETATMYVITPTANDNGTGRLNNYDMTYFTGTFTITRKAASVTPNAGSKTYGGADPTLTGTLTGFLVGDGVTASYSRTAGETVLGSPYTISAALSPAGVLGNYDITYNTAPLTLTRAATSTSLTSSLNPATYGQAITLTATVTSTAGVPTGSVTFTDGGTTLGSAPVNGSGVATLVVSLPAGARALTATYSGNSNFDGSAGNLTGSMAVATTSTTLNSSPNPSSPGQPVAFVATVIGQFGGAVTGVVTFKKGANPIGTALMIANGTATLTLSNLGTGPHVVTATLRRRFQLTRQLIVIGDPERSGAGFADDHECQLVAQPFHRRTRGDVHRCGNLGLSGDANRHHHAPAGSDDAGHRGDDERAGHLCHVHAAGWFARHHSGL